MAPHPHPHSDAIADCVLGAFHTLPRKYKPRRLADGGREWVPLAGIVVCRLGSLGQVLTEVGSRIDPQNRFSKTDHAGTPRTLKCVSLATGMKCLPQEKIKRASGNVLHDSHAEVLAIRGFNRWLVDECAELARGGFKTRKGGDVEEKEGMWVRWMERGKEELGSAGDDHDGKEGKGEFGGEGARKPLFELRPDIQLHMYCSEAPCGDVSMELVMQEQADSTPWARAPSPLPPEENGDGHSADYTETNRGLLGRGHFDQLGVVRRKPGRPDAPVTLSKSCSDKLAMKQCTGLLSALTARLVGTKGTWLSTLTLSEERVVNEAVARSFGPTGRMKGVLDCEVQERWRKTGFEYRPFRVLKTSRVFEYARDSSSSSSETESATVPSNLATLITPQNQEILINGVLQGRKQDDPRGASCVSRRRMWEGVRDVYHVLDRDGNESVGAGVVAGEGAMTYGELKTDFGREGGVLEAREMVKRDARALALKGWTRNEGAEDWKVE